MNGAVIFAQNNARFDYVKLAIFSAKQIKQYLDIPVSIITDSKDWLEKMYPDHPFDKIINVESSSNQQLKNVNDGSLYKTKIDWKNKERTSIYQLSPYDKTLVIDSDYILNSSILKSAFDNDYDLQIYRNSLDLAGWRDTSEFSRINLYSIPFYWATVFVFQKNTVMEKFFDLVEFIKTNWDYFKLLYNIRSDTYRNDFSFSIAIHILNGKTENNFAVELPGKMTYILDRDFLVNAKHNVMNFLVEKEKYLGEYTLVKTTGLDIHVMNKSSLSRFIDGGSGV
jgi:hypothetical protein